MKSRISSPSSGIKMGGMPTLNSLTLSLVLVAGQGVSCEKRVAEDSRADHAKPVTVQVDQTPPERIRMLGYGGLDPAIRARDLARINEQLGDQRWPTREVFHAVSLESFPLSAGKLESTVEPVPIYVIVDPAEIDHAWGELAQGGGQSDPYARIEGDNSGSSCRVFYFPSTRFFAGFSWISAPWPTWADSTYPTRDGNSKNLNLETHHWRVLATTLLGSHNLGSVLSEVNVVSTACFEIVGVSSTVWRAVVRRGNPSGANPPVRGQLVFPLFESVGLLRDEVNDDWKDERNGPMSSHVEAPETIWQLGGRNSLVLPAPRPDGVAAPNREYVIVPESLATFAVPVLCAYKSKSWKPLAEDFVFRIGPPTTTDGLRAVCVFMTCTDEQLREVVAAMDASDPKE